MANAKGSPGNRKGMSYSASKKLDPSQVQDARRNNVQGRQGNAAAKDKRRTLGR